MRLAPPARACCVRKWRVARVRRQLHRPGTHCPGDHCMNSSIVRWALAAAATLTVGAVAADTSDNFHHKRPDYRVVTLSSLGGAENAGNSINDLNVVGGFTNLPDNNSRHAMLWLYGFRFDLGTLGGPNSNIPWPVKNTNGLIAGIAQTT